MYKVLGADQKEYGPVTADTLRQWIAERRASGQTMICPDGSADWRALASFPEFSDALTQAFGAVATAAPGAGAAPQFAGAAKGEKNGLAITSLVLGIVGITCLLFITGIPAIITGLMALNRARLQPAEYGGRGFAIAGIVMGAISILLTLVSLGILLPALAKAKVRGQINFNSPAQNMSRAQSISCINNLKQIGLGARIYAKDHQGAFPANFEAMTNELSTPKILWCAADGSKTRAENWESFGSNNATYVWSGAGLNEKKVNLNQVIARCTIHESTVLADGSAHMGRGR